MPASDFMKQHVGLVINHPDYGELIRLGRVKPDVGNAYLPHHFSFHIVRTDPDYPTTKRFIKAEKAMDAASIQGLRPGGYPVSETESDEEDLIPEFKILVIDIETRPNLAYVWRVWRENIAPSQIIEEKEVISFAAKWLDEDETVFYSVHTHDKSDMIQAAWDLLDEADAVIHYNGKRFDVPHLNLEFLQAGLTPPSPFRQIDLINTIKREFKFTHNKLDHVATTLNIGSKVEHEGFDLWVKCMQDDPEAWARMEEYNIHDVYLTEQLYHEILPWITAHPSHAAIWGDMRCTNCGSPDLAQNGYQYTRTGRYKRYRCKSCGAHVRDTKRVAGAPVTQTSSW